MLDNGGQRISGDGHLSGNPDRVDKCRLGSMAAKGPRGSRDPQALRKSTMIAPMCPINLIKQCLEREARDRSTCGTRRAASALDVDPGSADRMGGGLSCPMDPLRADALLCSRRAVHDRVTDRFRWQRPRRPEKLFAGCCQRNARQIARAEVPVDGEGGCASPFDPQSYREGHLDGRSMFAARLKQFRAYAKLLAASANGPAAAPGRPRRTLGRSSPRRAAGRAGALWSQVRRHIGPAAPATASPLCGSPRGASSGAHELKKQPAPGRQMSVGQARWVFLAREAQPRRGGLGTGDIIGIPKPREAGSATP